MSEPTLDPCPFCGSKCFFNHEDVTNSRGEEYTRAWVECTGCDMRSIAKRVVYGVPAAKVMLSGLWNKRAPATPPADAALADDALCESLIEASDMRWNGDVYVGDGSDLMSLVRAALRARAVPQSAPAGFVEWLCQEMPPGTVISDPAWWAPKIHRAMLAASKEDGK